MKLDYVSAAESQVASLWEGEWAAIHWIDRCDVS